eukprot:130768-Chlamydomonas_euryale.AAC.3
MHDPHLQSPDVRVCGMVFVGPASGLQCLPGGGRRGGRSVCGQEWVVGVCHAAGGAGGPIAWGLLENVPVAMDESAQCRLSKTGWGAAHAVVGGGLRMRACAQRMHACMHT